MYDNGKKEERMFVDALIEYVAKNHTNMARVQQDVNIVSDVVMNGKKPNHYFMTARADMETYDPMEGAAVDKAIAGELEEAVNILNQNMPQDQFGQDMYRTERQFSRL